MSRVEKRRLRLSIPILVALAIYAYPFGAFLGVIIF